MTDIICNCGHSIDEHLIFSDYCNGVDEGVLCECGKNRNTVEFEYSRSCIEQLEATIVSMEHDAIDNTFTIRNLLQVNSAQAAEIAALKRELNTCKHLHVNIHSRLHAMETREEPADYEEGAQCSDCGKWMDTSDIPEDSEVSE